AMGLLISVVELAGYRQDSRAILVSDNNCGRVILPGFSSIGECECYCGSGDIVIGAGAGANHFVESGCRGNCCNTWIVRTLHRGHAGEMEAVALPPVDLEILR